MNRYLVLAMRKPGFDAAVVKPHHAFLDRLREQGQLELTGPFTDGSGGAYLLRAESLEAALAIVHADPLHVTGSSELTVREWSAK
jgi:uncharacterized protein YciI